MKYFKVTQKIVNKKGERTIIEYLTEDQEPMFEVVLKEEICKSDFFDYITNKLRSEELEFCKKNNLTLEESFKRQDGALYKYFWQHGIAEEEANDIFLNVKAELDSHKRVFAANKTRTWGGYFYEGYVPEGLDLCSVEDMVSDDIL